MVFRVISSSVLEGLPDPEDKPEALGDGDLLITHGQAPPLRRGFRLAIRMTLPRKDKNGPGGGKLFYTH